MSVRVLIRPLSGGDVVSGVMLRRYAQMNTENVQIETATRVDSTFIT